MITTYPGLTIMYFIKKLKHYCFPCQFAYNGNQLSNDSSLVILLFYEKLQVQNLFHTARILGQSDTTTISSKWSILNQR